MRSFSSSGLGARAAREYTLEFWLLLAASLRRSSILKQSDDLR